MSTALRLSGSILVRHRPTRQFRQSVASIWHASDLAWLHREDDQNANPDYHHHPCPNYNVLAQTTARAYHTTAQRPLVLYGTIIIVTAAGYVIYRKSQGKPIAPDSLIDAKRDFAETGGQYSRAAFERRQAEKQADIMQEQQQQPAPQSSTAKAEDGSNQSSH